MRKMPMFGCDGANANRVLPVPALSQALDETAEYLRKPNGYALPAVIESLKPEAGRTRVRFLPTMILATARLAAVMVWKPNPVRSFCGCEEWTLVSVYDLKPKFQNLLRPLCTGLAHAGITANQVTTSAAVMSSALGCAIAATHGAVWTLYLMPPVLFARMALNAIDGMLAREFNQKSRLGAVLNELGDVVSDTALYLPFAIVAGVSPILVSLVVVIGVMTEMAGVVAVQIGATRRYDGPFGKSDRALFFGALALALGIGLQPGLWTEVVLALAALAGLLTIFNRARGALKETAA